MTHSTRWDLVQPRLNEGRLASVVEVEVGSIYILQHRNGWALLRPARVLAIDPSVRHLDGGAIQFVILRKDGEWGPTKMMLSATEFRERIVRKATDDDLRPVEAESGSPKANE